MTNTPCDTENILRIDAIDVEPALSVTAIHATTKQRATVRATIQSYCMSSGKLFSAVMLESNAVEHNRIGAVRKAIENFINSKLSHLHIQTLDVDTDFTNPSRKIDTLDIHYIPEPFKSLFEQLFNKNVWSIPNKEIS